MIPKAPFFLRKPPPPWLQKVAPRPTLRTQGPTTCLFHLNKAIASDWCVCDGGGIELWRHKPFTRSGPCWCAGQSWSVSGGQGVIWEYEYIHSKQAFVPDARIVVEYSINHEINKTIFRDFQQSFNLHHIPNGKSSSIFIFLCHILYKLNI